MMNLEDIADMILEKAFPHRDLSSIETIDELIDKIKAGELKNGSILETDYLLTLLYEMKEEIESNVKEVDKKVYE